MTTYLSRDDILNAQDFRTDEVDVPEWGGAVLVRELSAADADRIGFSMADKQGNIDLSKAEGIAMRTVVLGVIDEEHRRIFTGKDVRTLGGRSHLAVNRVAKRIMQLTGLAPETDEELIKAILEDGRLGLNEKQLKALSEDVVKALVAALEVLPKAEAEPEPEANEDEGGAANEGDESKNG